MAANCCGLSRRLISIVRDRGSLARLECLAPCLLCSAAAFGLPAPMKPPMHAVACFVTPDPEKREELLQTLRSLAEVIRREPGCLVCSVCIEETSAFLIVVSGWASDADLRRHLRSEHFQVLSGASRLLGASAEVGFLASHPSVDSPLAEPP